MDLEEGYAVVHKDKLKAVITPLLRDSSLQTLRLVYCDFSVYARMRKRG